jgi:hypothetical protein
MSSGFVTTSHLISLFGCAVHTWVELKACKSPYTLWSDGFREPSVETRLFQRDCYMQLLDFQVRLGF